MNNEQQDTIRVLRLIEQPGWDARDTDLLGRITQLPMFVLSNLNGGKPLVSQEAVVECIRQIANVRYEFLMERLIVNRAANDKP